MTTQPSDYPNVVVFTVCRRKRWFLAFCLSLFVWLISFYIFPFKETCFCLVNHHHLAAIARPSLPPASRYTSIHTATTFWKNVKVATQSRTEKHHPFPSIEKTKQGPPLL